MAPRLHQALLIGATLLASWLGMQAVHESGHVLAAWLTGGTIRRVVLHPLTFSRTDLATNPQPLPVAWAGAVVGSVLPLLGWWLARWLRWRCQFVLRFFAGFCLLVNGLYLSFGALEQVGDAGDLLRHGAASWQLWGWGVLTAPLGLWLWNGLGASFGLGAAKGRVDRFVAYLVTGIAAALLLLALLVGDGPST